MNLKCFLLLCIIFLTFLHANNEKVDCIIIEDENSIFCKYTHRRVSSDKGVTAQWIEPDGTISRTRDMVIPAFHGSIYDYRYIEGRTKGVWTFKVIDKSNEFSTTFKID